MADSKDTRYVLPKFLPELGLPLTSDVCLLAQLFDKKGIAHVRSAIMRGGVIYRPHVTSPLMVNPPREEGGQDVYWFRRAGKEYVLNDFTPLTVQLKDENGEILHTYTTGDVQSPAQ